MGPLTNIWSQCFTNYMQFKVCSTCKHNKSVDEFSVKNKRTGTKQSRCKACFNEYQRQKYDLNPELARQKQIEKLLRAKNKVRNLPQIKCCLTCSKVYPASDFKKEYTSIDGLSNECLNCVNLRVAIKRGLVSSGTTYEQLQYECEYCHRKFATSVTSGHKNKCPEFLKVNHDRKPLACLCGHESTSLTQMKRHRKECEIWLSRDKNSVANSRIKTTLQNKYGPGITNPIHIPESRLKALKTNLERYGATSVFSKNSILYEKVQSYWDGKDRTAHLPKNNFAKPEIKEKIRNFYLKNYGVESGSQVPEIRAKQLLTSFQRYGDEQPFRVDSIREKGKKTLLEKYGVEDAAQSPEVLEKIQQTNMERYGVPWTTLGESREKQYETQIQKYGDKYFASEEGKRKVAESLPERLTKIRQTNMERYGVPHPMQNLEYARNHLEKLHAKNGKNNLETRFHELYPFLYFSGDGDFWRSVEGISGSKCPDFVWKVESLDSGVSFRNITHVIELFGDYWHNEENIGKPKEEHVKEITEFWEATGLKCLILWENEIYKGREILDPKISEFLEIDLRKFGIGPPNYDFEFKNVNVKVIENNDKEIRKFLDSNHYARFGRMASKIYAAYLDEELVAIVKYASPIRQDVGPSIGYKNSDILELDRFCIHPSRQKKNFASWIMSKSINLVKKDMVTLKALVSFADLRFGHHGGIYRASNWTQIGQTSKSYVYIDPDGNELNKKTLYQQAKVIGLKEKEYCEFLGLRKLTVPAKNKYVYKLI